jgi:membrane-bound acyltransferase YfiQ involved in biofilm formation
MSVLLPYCVWTVIYVWLHAPHLAGAAFTGTVLRDLLTGQAAYQLYYILITVQFYLLFPVFLRFLRRVQRFPWHVLMISFMAQWFLLFIDYHYLQTGSVHGSGLIAQIVLARGNYVLFYPFPFVLGGLCAIYWPQVHPLLLRYGAWAAWGAVAALLGVFGHFYFRVDLRHQPMTYVSSPIQPLTLFTTLAALGCFGWLACRWAERRDAAGQPPGARYWKLLSDASFGVFLLHAAVLTAIVTHILPALSPAVPGALRVLLTWLLAAGITTALSVLLARLPALSWLVGRPRAFSAGISPRAWPAAVRRHLATEPPMTVAPRSSGAGGASDAGA